MTSPKREIFKAATEICMARLGRPVPSKKEFAARVAELEASMGALWYGSSCTDFSFYADPDYLWLALNSWTVRSMGDVDEVIRMRLHGPPLGCVLDFHGGIGMTAVRLAMALPEVTCVSHSAVPDHRAIALELAARFGLKNVAVTDDPHSHSDVGLLIAQETFEHFRDPFAELRKLLDATRPRRYLDGSSFGIDSPGHFPEYWDGVDKDGRPCDVVERGAPTKRRFNAILKLRGYRPYWKRLGCKAPYNSHPYLWMRDDALMLGNEGP